MACCMYQTNKRYPLLNAEEYAKLRQFVHLPSIRDKEPRMCMPDGGGGGGGGVCMQGKVYIFKQ